VRVGRRVKSVGDIHPDSFLVTSQSHCEIGHLGGNIVQSRGGMRLLGDVGLRGILLGSVRLRYVLSLQRQRLGGKILLRL
jgi:hypothetical protein